MLVEASMSAQGVQTLMNEVEADLTDFLNAIIKERVFEPKLLYHYTSIEGLVGIVSTRKFFLSDMMASTDQSEIRYGLNVVREVLKDQSKNLVAAKLLEGFPETELWWGIGRHLFVHAVCFCATNDVLTQWRGYSPVGGAAISLNFGELRLRADHGEFALGPMFYGNDVQQALVKRMLTRGEEHLRRLPFAFSDMYAAEVADAGNDLLFRVAQRLLILALYFKHPAFASEQEWRVFSVETDDPRGLKFRIRGGAIAPYVELPFEPSLISEIRCSPGNWSRSALYAVERLAKSLGDVRVTRSDLPL
jgi:hypothetical protein